LAGVHERRPAYNASERLDCACHVNSPERDAAIALERDAAIALENLLRTIDPSGIDAGLLQAVTATWL
jgi:hypothetical protein